MGEFRIFELHFFHLLDNCYINGRMEILKWLLALGLINSDSLVVGLKKSIQKGFILTCVHGHLEMANWLFDFGIQFNMPVDLHAKNDDAFVSACIGGHLDVAKYLYNATREMNSLIVSETIELAIYNCEIYKKENMIPWLYEIGEGSKMIQSWTQKIQAFNCAPN